MLILSIVEMADILWFNLTETDSHAPRKMCCSLSTESPYTELLLRLMGVDVASFRDFFADKRMTVKTQAATAAFDNTPAGELPDAA